MSGTDDKYLNFLKSKIQTAPVSGFDVDPGALHSALMPHQRDALIWALHGGRRALFESFGLGKTVQELEYCRQVLLHEGSGRALIVLPLGVRQEFTHDAVEILHMAPPVYITSMSGAEATPDGAICMTNYERVRDGDIDPAAFAACVLDEAALLPHGSNFWYGTTVTGPDDTWRALEMPRRVHTFWSVEPMMGPVMFPLLPDYIIVGAETGNRKDKIIPERKWVEVLSLFAKEANTPVIWKDNIRKLYPDLPKSAPMPGKEG